jgi:RNA polymerase sigma-70 factor, ECF subfamily
MLFKKSEIRSHHKSDDELISEFTSSANIEVLGELYSGYMHLVYGVCLKYLKDREESKDAVMQIFEKLIIELPRHKIENFRSWLHVVTKNYCLMQLRSKKSHDLNEREWMIDSVNFMENDLFMHPVDEDSTSMDDDLAECISLLKGEQKECIQQFYYENRCYNEIALKLGIEEKKVKSYLQNAKRNLKLCLEKKHVRQESK